MNRVVVELQHGANAIQRTDRLLPRPDHIGACGGRNSTGIFLDCAKPVVDHIHRGAFMVGMHNQAGVDDLRDRRMGGDNIQTVADAIAAMRNKKGGFVFPAKSYADRKLRIATDGFWPQTGAPRRRCRNALAAFDGWGQGTHCRVVSRIAQRLEQYGCGFVAEIRV